MAATTCYIWRGQKTKPAKERPPGTFEVLVNATKKLLAFLSTLEVSLRPSKHYREEREKTIVRNNARAGLFHNKKQSFTVQDYRFPPTCSTMEASRSQAVHSPTTVVIRQRPVITIAPNGPPPKRVYVSFLHPANGLPFLDLPAYDYCSQVPNGGIHYGTGLSACEILACNEKGYLSISRNRDGVGRLNVDRDTIIPSGRYYYHLDTETSDPLYPICQDFSCWEFPHQRLPSAWGSEPADYDDVWPTDWIELSYKVKVKGIRCCASGSLDSLTVARIVPRIQERWVCNLPSSQVVANLSHCQLLANKMEEYLLGDRPLYNDHRNLFTLRCDLHLGQFNQGRFIIVPKSGQLVVHFIRPTGESAQLYHNVQFDHKSPLCHELLYARLAWGLMKIVKDAELDPEMFNLIRGSEKTIPEQCNMDTMGDDSGRGGQGQSKA
jgi:hypothetical protein